MNSLLAELRACFAAGLEVAFGDRGREVDPLIRASTEEKFGDYQCNVAMSLAKQLGEKPRDVAARLVEGVQQVLTRGQPWFVVQIDGPGFINIRLRREYLEERLSSVAPIDPAAAATEDRLGLRPLSPDARDTVVVDYSSPNVAKPMHVGHLRSTIIGDTIARVLGFLGHEVIRQNHLGDWGTQFGMIILGVWHLCMSQRRGEPDDALAFWTARLTAASKQGADALAPLLEELRARHQADLDADPDGTAFQTFLAGFQPRLDRLVSAYQFVNAVEAAAERSNLTLTDPRSGAVIPMSKVSNQVVAMLQRGGQSDAQEREAWRVAVRGSLAECAATYRRLGVLLEDADVRGESFYHKMLPGVVEELSLRLAEGRSDPASPLRAVFRVDRGAACVFVERPDGTPAFKGPQGDPLPMIVRKSDGAFLYATTDLAAVLFRVAHPTRHPVALASRSLAEALHRQGGGLGATRVIYVVGAPQKLHFEMLFAVVQALGWTRTADAARPVRLEHVAFGSVLGDDRRPLRTRSGENVTLRELLDEAERRAAELIEHNEAKRAELGLDPLSADERAEITRAVGIGAVKYADLSQNRGSDYVFSWDKMLAMQGNTAPYLMYAYARIRSIYRKGAAVASADATPVRLAHPAEAALGRRLLQFSETLEAVAQSLLPSLLCDYAYELAAAFMRFYESCPVLQAEDDATRASRLRLCDLTARTLRVTLGLLGVRAIEKM